MSDDIGFGVAGCHGTIAPQQDEAFYDDRSDASDDENKGRLKFPTRLYGRDKELDALRQIYDGLAQSSSDSDYGKSRVVLLGGYSGVGKSRLITEFIAQASARHGSPDKKKEAVISASGKFTERSSEPFSAFTQLLGQLADELMASEELHSKVMAKIDQSELIGSDNDAQGRLVLTSTFPSLSPLLGGSSKSRTLGMNAIIDCTIELLHLVATNLDCPLILFADDWQWADTASLQLVQSLLTSQIQSVICVCAYRSNEVPADHSFAKVIDEVKSARNKPGLIETIAQIDLYSLSPEAIRHFVADSIKRDEVEEASDLAEVIYKKTMGNIFFTKQSLEELVRKNVVFYDMMCFEWQYVLSKVELTDCLSDDVVSTVKSKIACCSGTLQDVLVVMSHIPFSPDVSTLARLIDTADRYTEDEIRNALREAADESMLIISSCDKLYTFAHDRIRQASQEFVDGERRNKIRRRIANVLLDGDDASLFVAAEILNSLPIDKAEDATVALMAKATLNLRVATIAKSRGSIEKENELLMEALSSLEQSGKKWADYNFTLDLLNAIIKCSFSLGRYEVTSKAINEILERGRSLDDKINAYLYDIDKYDPVNEYDEGVKRGVAVLRMYGFDIPTSLSPSKTFMAKEDVKLQLALRNSYLNLQKLSDQELPLMSVFQLVARYCLFTNRDTLSKLICWKAVIYASKRGFDRAFPRLLAMLATALVKEGKIKRSIEVGNVCVLLTQRIIDDREMYSFSKFPVLSGVICQLHPYRSVVDPLLVCYKDLKMAGRAQPAIGAALNYVYSFLASGSELNPIYESRLSCMEEYCRKGDRKANELLMQLFRQISLNLRKEDCADPTAFTGPAFDEEKDLRGIPDQMYSYVSFDVCILRLFLAVLFWDEALMAEMLDKLQVMPSCFNDVSTARTHVRLTYMALAAFGLKRKEYGKLGEKCLDYFVRLAKLGSVDSLPVKLFVLALKKPKKTAFEQAIDACNEAKLLQLEALAKERYAVFLRDNGCSKSNAFMEVAYWSYLEWGAMAKVKKMRRAHPFLAKSNKAKANSITLSGSNDDKKSSSTGGPPKFGTSIISFDDYDHVDISINNRRSSISKQRSVTNPS
mmetsp:Transcript_8321/g.19077  ORF Transcript_8321/g.19077 Transcript_8321/m.19077 type:complete len:1103 (+) Transcript_8321:335-3643(+)